MKTVQNISGLKSINGTQKYSSFNDDDDAVEDNYRFNQVKSDNRPIYRKDYYHREEDIPYHARENSEPFSYGINQDMIGGSSGSGGGNVDSRGLSSPSLVRKAIVNKSHGNTLEKVQTGVYLSPKPVPNFQNDPSTNYTPHHHLNNNHSRTPPTTTRSYLSPKSTYNPIDDLFTDSALKAQPITKEFKEEYYKDERKRFDPIIRNHIRPYSPEKYNYETYSELTTSPYSDTDTSLSPLGFSRNNTKSPEFYQTSTTTNGGLTWLQRQQQKLKERKELRLREQRQPHETRLFNELKEIQLARRHYRQPIASHRLDGYTSDTTAFADDDDDDDDNDYYLPLHINTIQRNGGTVKLNSNERPFMAVKRAHEMYSQNNDPVKSLVSHPHGQIIRVQSNTTSNNNNNNNNNHSVLHQDKNHMGLLSVVDCQQQQQYNGSTTSNQQQHVTVGILNGFNITASTKTSTNSLQFRFDILDELMASLSSCSNSSTTSTSTTNSFDACFQYDQSIRSQSSPMDLEISPLYNSSSSRPQTPAFPVTGRSPVSFTQNTMQIEQFSERLPPKSPLVQRRSIDHQSDFEIDGQIIQRNTFGYMESGRNLIQPSSPIYFGHSRHGSQSSSSGANEQLVSQEVSAANVKIVSDTSRFWYKPKISRDDAIKILRDKPPGTFIVRDSNSFPGAFGLALRVATVPINFQQQIRSNNGPDELIRHFLIEPTSKGVRIKGCPNEPVFSSLSALIYQHSITQIALPCQLILPEMDIGPETKTNIQADLFQQQVNTQGAACNVVYLQTYDMESLTGPQAIIKAVKQLLKQSSHKKQSLIVNFKVNSQGITLTDNKRKLFFRKHYPINTISYCGLDPDNNTWLIDVDDGGNAKSTKRIFGYVARKPNITNPDNQCHLFAELDPHQPATAIISFVNKILTQNGIKLSN